MDKSKILNRLIEDFQVFHCVECGKCTGACPLAQVDCDFSPRLVAKYAIDEGIDSEYVREKAWTCLTCGLCNERCPVGISFTEFVRAIRPLYTREDFRGHMSHGGALHGLMRMQTAPSLNQNRLDWITPDLKVSSKGEILYFVGCLPHFETFFSEMNVNLVKIAIDTVKILNSLGIEPVVLPDERCCGHDLIWTGDEESFHKLRRLNIESFREAGVKTIVTACGECSYVLGHLYAKSMELFSFEVMHLSEYLQKVGFHAGKISKSTATYQDPCRLGRFCGVYDAPRELLGSILELREMPHFGHGAWCCGNSAWLHCDRYSKQMQVSRLLEAKGTKSDLIVTACPKCQVHLTCAMRDVNCLQDLTMKIKDLSSVIAESMEGDDL
ncbi:MAG: (Fe-S)-binding protein [Desulfobacteraceae bacterium]|nr:MAG: (Fe-S)-binding protein [Desulfobacteraceae bacterium]